VTVERVLPRLNKDTTIDIDKNQQGLVNIKLCSRSKFIKQTCRRENTPFPPGKCFFGEGEEGRGKNGENAKEKRKKRKMESKKAGVKFMEVDGREKIQAQRVCEE
jgi:hypothetical protein